MTKLRIHFLQHVPFEGPGYIETWIRKNNHALSSTMFYYGDTLPLVDDFDWLIIMGGPMGIYSNGTRDYCRRKILWRHQLSFGSNTGLFSGC
jgi:GMP synthase-like glutamine amidotransferase